MSDRDPTELLPPYVACPTCHSPLEPRADELHCASCGAVYARRDGIPLLFAHQALADDEERVQALYDHVADEYDEVFSPHVLQHYLDKRLGVIRAQLHSGRVLDVGCGTGALAGHVAAHGYEVVGLDVSPGMLAQAMERNLASVFAAFASEMPFADNSFDLAYTVATLHHFETTARVAAVIGEIGRVVRPGGVVLIWDHNPLNPYWSLLMRRVPQDSGDERLVAMPEILADVQAAGLRTVSARRLGLVPDFMPAPMMPLARAAERCVEAVPLLSNWAAHNVVIARKPSSA